MGANRGVQETGEPAEPRPAATLVIVRDGPAGPEVLLTVRPRRLRFMGGATVFPGGSVAPADLHDGWEERSVLRGDDAAAALGLNDRRAALGSYVAALRETYEEVGLLLAEDPAAARAVPRAAAEDGGSFLAAIRAADTRLRTDRLVAAGRWVTPFGSPLRFDTRFFAAAAPEGWEPEPDPDEVDSCRWATPSAALTELAAGRVVMAPPTVEMLQRLEGYGSTEKLLGGISSRGVRGAGNVLSVRLSPFVHVVLAPNAGMMTGPGTNSYIVGAPGGGGTAIIDPATSDEEYVEALLEAAGEVRAILVTHRHADHVGGAQVVATRTGAPLRAWGEEPAGGVDVVPLRDGESLRFGNVSLEVVHAPGHSSDHVCLFYPDAATLFAGDNVLGEGTAVIAPPDGNMRAFMSTLRRLERLDVDRIYPGHFKPLDGGRAVIRALIEHRERRERIIMEALSQRSMTLDELVPVAYEDTPRELHPVARFSALAHLEKLVEEGRVEFRVDRWASLEAV